MPRLPFVDQDTAPPEVKEALEAAPPLGLFRMVAHASGAFRPWLRYGAALLTELELDPVLRELVILEVAHLSDAEYEWAQHTGIHLAVGGTQEHIDAIEAGDIESDAFDDDQRAVLRVTRFVVEDGGAPEDEIKALAEALGPRQVVELLLVVGQYMAVARLIAATGLEPDPPVAPGGLTGD